MLAEDNFRKQLVCRKMEIKIKHDPTTKETNIIDVLGNNILVLNVPLVTCNPDVIRTRRKVSTTVRGAPFCLHAHGDRCPDRIAVITLNIINVMVNVKILILATYF